MATTPKYGLPTPNTTEAADVPTDMSELALAVEVLLSTGTVDLTGGTIKVKAPAANDQPLRRADVVIGPAASAPAYSPALEGTVYLGY